MASSLNQRLERIKPTTFAPFKGEKLQAMNTLKNALISLFVLEFPYSSGHMTFKTDACKVQIGSLLLHK